MKLTTKNLLKTLTEGFIYVLLFVSFIYFYMRDQMSDYFAGRTTITSRFAEADVLEFPTITICLRPGSKPSVGKDYGFDRLHHIFKKEVENSTMFERFEKLSYKMNRDFEMHINWHPDKLELGTNARNFYQVFEVEPIRTEHHGTCYKIQPTFEVTKVPVYFHLRVTLSPNLLEMDKPQGFDLFLTSNVSWHGTTYELWPQFQPTKISTNFKDDQVGYRWNVVEINFRNGTTNYKKCQDETIKNANCSIKCYMHSYGSLPPCENLKDFKCMRKHIVKDSNAMAYCFKPKKAILYNPLPYPSQRYSPINNSSSEVYMSFWTMRKEIRDEIEIIATTDLIGSVGGSMGMFFGFSLSAWIIYVMRFCVSK